MASAVLSLLMPFAFSLVTNTTSVTSSGPYLVMLYGNRRISDGETVPVYAARDQLMQEALVTCLATNVVATEHILVFQFYAQNAMLLEPKNMSANTVNDDGTLIIGHRRVRLEAGGFLKLHCQLNTHSTITHSTNTITSTTANFTFAYEGDPDAKRRPPSSGSPPLQLNPNAAPGLPSRLQTTTTPLPLPPAWRPLSPWSPHQQQPANSAAAPTLSTSSSFSVFAVVVIAAAATAALVSTATT